MLSTTFVRQFRKLPANLQRRIRAVCDAAPGTCVGPVTLLPNTTLLVTPQISMNTTTPPTTALITHQPDGAVGPFYTNVTVPVLNFTIPVTFCPHHLPPARGGAWNDWRKHLGDPHGRCNEQDH